MSGYYSLRFSCNNKSCTWPFVRLFVCSVNDSAAFRQVAAISVGCCLSVRLSSGCHVTLLSRQLETRPDPKYISYRCQFSVLLIADSCRYCRWAIWLSLLGLNCFWTSFARRKGHLNSSLRQNVSLFIGRSPSPPHLPPIFLPSLTSISTVLTSPSFRTLFTCYPLSILQPVSESDLFASSFHEP